MNIPTNLQRFADFMATHSSPEGCIAGRRYMVPCISHPKLWPLVFANAPATGWRGMTTGSRCGW